MGDKIGTLLMMNELEFFAICPVKKESVWSDYTVHWIFLFSSTNSRTDFVSSFFVVVLKQNMVEMS